jgi:hypothetical protein
MRHAGMVGLLGEDFLENFACLSLVGVSLVRGRRGGQEREGIKNRGFAIAGVTLGHLLHRFFIRQSTRAVVNFVEIFVERGDGSDIVTLPVFPEIDCAWATEASPFLSVSVSGVLGQSGGHRLTATPHEAMLHLGSAAAIERKDFSASSYQNEWSMATACSNCGCTVGEQEVGK